MTATEASDALAAMDVSLADAQFFVEDVLHGPNCHSTRFTLSVSGNKKDIYIGTGQPGDSVRGSSVLTMARMVAALENVPAPARNAVIHLEDPHQGIGLYTEDIVVTTSRDGGTVVIRTQATEDEYY